MNEVDLKENEQEFVNLFSRLVNGGSPSYKRVGYALACDHRYLIQEKFKIVLAFMEALALNYHKGYYDGRDEYSCKCCADIIDMLIKENLYTPSEDYQF